MTLDGSGFSDDVRVTFWWGDPRSLCPYDGGRAWDTCSWRRLSCHDCRQFGSWGRTAIWRLSSTCQHHWRKQFFFFISGAHFGGENFFWLKKMALSTQKMVIFGIYFSSALSSSSTSSVICSSVYRWDGGDIKGCIQGHGTLLILKDVYRHMVPWLKHISNFITKKNLSWPPSPVHKKNHPLYPLFFVFTLTKPLLSNFCTRVRVNISTH